MRSYQKVHATHHKEIIGVFDGFIEVEEKVDGSQFRIEIHDDGSIHCGSHHQEVSNVDSMFKRGTDSAQEVFKEMVMRPQDRVEVFAEYLSKPKHGKIPYQRVPENLFIVFDVIVNGVYLRRDEKEAFCSDYGLEVVPLLWSGEGKDFTEEKKLELLKSQSILGHQAGYDKIEGMVIKNYDKTYGVGEEHSLYGHFMCTKIVNVDYQEVKKISKVKGQGVEDLKESLCTPARWEKAKIHLEERGELTGDMKDIALFMKEVMLDVKTEEMENIKDKLWDIYGKDILKASTQGLVP